MNRLKNDKAFYIMLAALCFALEVVAWAIMDAKGVPTLAEEMQLFFPGS